MKKSLLLVALLGAFFFDVMATNGYFMMGYGTISKGMGGCGVAYYKTSIIGGNPAGNAFLEKECNIAASLLFPTRSYTVTGQQEVPEGMVGLALGEVESDTRVLFIPSGGSNWRLNDKMALGLSCYGSGLNTNYPTRTFGDENAGSTGLNLVQVFANPTFSMKLMEKHSLGVSAILCYQRFEVEGATLFSAFSQTPDKVSNNGADNNSGIGFKVGYMGEVFNGFYLGGTYQSRIKTSEFEDYKGLFAEQGSFDVPANFTVGLNYAISDKVRALFDVQQIYYSDVKAVGNKMNVVGLMTGTTPLGGDKGPGFGWEDMTIYKFGTEYTASESLLLRAGFSTGNNPVSDSEVTFNIFAPGVIKNHISLGASSKIGAKGRAVHASFYYAFNNSVKGNNPFATDPATGTVFQEIEIEMSQWELEVSFSF